MVLCQVSPLRRPSLRRGILKRVRESETNCSEFLSSIMGRGYPMNGEGPGSKGLQTLLSKVYRNRRKQAKNGEIYYAVVKESVKFQ